MKKALITLATLATLATTVGMTAQAASTKLDVNSDGFIDSVDASMVLKEYAAISSGKDTSFNKTQLHLADYDNNGMIDSVDAAGIMQVYAKNAVGDTQPVVELEFAAIAIKGGKPEVIATYSSYEEAQYTTQWHKERARMKGWGEYKYRVEVWFVSYDSK
jgi:Na+-translocating ferredoxin:NAD+ oxidoreductase RNF subunit RnfB